MSYPSKWNVAKT